MQLVMDIAIFVVIAIACGVGMVAVMILTVATPAMVSWTIKTTFGVFPGFRKWVCHRGWHHFKTKAEIHGDDLATRIITRRSVCRWCTCIQWERDDPGWGYLACREQKGDHYWK